LVLTFCADSRGPPPCSFFVSVFADTIIEHQNSRAFWKPEILFYEMLTVPVFFFSMILNWAPVGYLLGIKRKKIKMSDGALRHAISSRRGVPKLKGHQSPALGTHYFRNAPAQVHYPTQNLDSAGWNEPLNSYSKSSLHTMEDTCPCLKCVMPCSQGLRYTC
jgi:hypothetical protein